jgi:hypothetical protein
VPSSKGVSAGPIMTAFLNHPQLLVGGGVKRQMGRRYHVITLSAIGLALTPAGGSVCMRLKSRISLLRAAVDILTRSSLS